MLAAAHSAPSLDFSTFDQRAGKRDGLSVVFLGGSLTWGAQATNPMDPSYRALEMIAEGLDSAREHEIEISPILKPGEELRIVSVCAAGGPAGATLATSMQ